MEGGEEMFIKKLETRFARGRSDKNDNEAEGWKGRGGGRTGYLRYM